MNKIIFLLCAILLISCEKNIDFKLHESANVLVVDAQIENGMPPTVILTKSVSFFSRIQPEILANSFVHNAEVYLSNGTLTHKLKEYAYLLVPGYIAYIYTIDSSNLSTAFFGELNKGYSLKIISEGKEYNSNVRIPAIATYPDSIWFKKTPFSTDTTSRDLVAKIFDPPGLGNYVRYFTKRNSGPYLAADNSVYNDEVIDGTTYEAQLPQGFDKNDPPNHDSNYFKRGDTITLKFCNIDKGTYNFWSGWEFAFQSIGDPFSQPNKVLSNISNGALGVFSGYGAKYITKIVE